MKTKSSRFDRLVARYYPAVYSFAARLTDDPREAVALTREAFNGARKQLQSIRESNGDRDGPDRCSSTCGTWRPPDLTFVTPNFALPMLAITAA